MQISYEPHVHLDDKEKEFIKALIESQQEPHVAVIRYIEGLLTQAYREETFNVKHLQDG